MSQRTDRQPQFFVFIAFSLGMLAIPSLAATPTPTPATSNTIELASYSNYFHTSYRDTTSSNLYYVFAGRTKNSTGEDCTTNNSSFTSTATTCDSCAKLASANLTSTVEACNNTEIYPSLYFTVTLKSTNADHYKSCSSLVVARIAGGDTIIAGEGQSSFTVGVASQSVSASFKWSDLCNLASSDGDCAKSFSKKFEFTFDPDCSQSSPVSGGPQVYVNYRFVQTTPSMSLGCTEDANASIVPQAYEGICNYTAAPGDGKVYITNVIGATTNDFKVADLTTAGAAASSADSSGMTYTHFRVYYKPTSEGAPGTMTYASSYQDLALDGTTLNEKRVMNLTNNVAYAFWGAMVDAAGTVTLFPAALGASQVATPQEVFGVLDNKGCFVATAAYGTAQAKQIQVLRDFRDIYLARTEIGRSFIRFYYRHSPAWAAWIADHEFARSIVRGFLAPILLFAQMSLRYGFGPTALSAVLTLMGLAWLARRSRREKVPHFFGRGGR